MEKKPIILIPGIQGTKLSNTNEVDFQGIWSGIKKYFSNIHDLILQYDGESDKGAENIIERADVENMAYSEIVNYLRSIGYRVFIFGYDWRKSNVDSGEDLAAFVTRIQRKLKESKINFLTHSMGCLVLSAYLIALSDKERSNYINRIIFTVPPFLGSVEATYNLVIGKSRLFNSSDDFRKVGRTFPGLYELLPVYKDSYKIDKKKKFNFYKFDDYWQQVTPVTKDKTKQKHRLISHRLEELGKVRDQNNFIFDFNTKSTLDLNERMLILVAGGEKTKTKIRVLTDKGNYRYYFDFGKYKEEKDGGDGTVPLASSTVFKKEITTLKLDASWLEKRADSRMIMSDWHAFFLNNGRVQNIIKRFFNPYFEKSDGWYKSGGGNIEELK